MNVKKTWFYTHSLLISYHNVSQQWHCLKNQPNDSIFLFATKKHKICVVEKCMCAMLSKNVSCEKSKIFFWDFVCMRFFNKMFSFIYATSIIQTWKAMNTIQKKIVKQDQNQQKVRLVEKQQVSITVNTSNTKQKSHHYYTLIISKLLRIKCMSRVKKTHSQNNITTKAKQVPMIKSYYSRCMFSSAKKKVLAYM